MTVGRLFGKTGRGLVVAAAILAAIGLTTVPRPADAGGGWGGGHCQLSRPWYASCVGGEAARVRNRLLAYCGGPL